MVLILKLCLLSCFCVPAVDMTVEMVNVYFSSVNFRTTLHWDAVCDVEHPCTYKVKYQAYGDPNWTNKPDCWGTQNFCDLTAETLQKQHVEDMIFAKVSTNVTSQWIKSKPFMPIRDTNISVPAVRLSASTHTIVVYITTPPLLYFSMYPEKRKNKKVFYNIAISKKSKLLWTEVTEQNVWKITQLPPDHYCISVQMRFEERTSHPSPQVCVNLKELVIKEVILGSAVAFCVSMLIAAIVAIYLLVCRRVVHPVAHLPSNLIFNDVKLKSSASDYKSTEAFLAPSIFEGMEFCKHSQESDNNEEHPQNKRYVSTETWRKDYVNFRQKYSIPEVSSSITVELRNSTYGANAAVDCLLDYPSIWDSPETKDTETKDFLHYGHMCNEYDYYNELTAGKEGFKKPCEPYSNQEEKSNCFYVNDQFQAYSNISGNT